MKFNVLSILSILCVLEALNAGSYGKDINAKKCKHFKVADNFEQLVDCNSPSSAAFNKTDTKKIKAFKGNLRYVSANESKKKSSCAEVYSGRDGEYTIEPDGWGTTKQVYCKADIYSKNKAWTVILLRKYGWRVDFDVTFDDYIEGFGDPSGEYFIGLDILSFITNQKRHELWIQVSDDSNHGMSAVYDHFAIGDYYDDYMIHTLGLLKNEGVGFDNFRTHMGMPFSARENDKTTQNCATKYNAGWWFYKKSVMAHHDCADIYLTSKYTHNNSLPEYTFHHFDVNGSRVTNAFMAIRRFRKTKD